MCLLGAGTPRAADSPDFLKLLNENAIKSEFSDLRGQFLEDLRSLTPLTFGSRRVPDLGSKMRGQVANRPLNMIL